MKDLQSEGKIEQIGLCNFDSTVMDEICTELGPGIIVANQVQVRYGGCSFGFIALWMLIRI